MHPQGNIISYLALFGWIPIALWVGRRWPPAKAAALLFLIPLMFLPERTAFKLPGLPNFDKGRIAIFWLLIAVLLFHRERLATVRLGKWIKFAILILLGGSVVTVFLNTDPVSYGSVYMPAHDPYDAVHNLLTDMLDFILPFTLAAAMFNGPKDLRVFFRVLVGAALAYSILQIVELRLSPQLHRWVYGFFQHSFQQAARRGGYRPMVFMSHGLAVAMFTAAGVLAAAGLYKSKITVFRMRVGWAFAYLWIILFLSKSVAAFLYTLVAVPLILFATPKTQFRVAALLAVVVFLYPDIRGSGLVPVDDIRAWVVSEYGEDRAQSLMVRFTNEEILLERANERSFFGWGAYCRNCVYDQVTGEPSSVSDGDWIITWGTYGRVGFVGKYLLLLVPIFLSASRLKYVRRMSDRRLLSTLALILGFTMFDLLPNGNFNYLVFMFSGVLMGCSEGILRHQAWQAELERERKIARRTVGRSRRDGSAPLVPAQP
ncbi:MAG: hypothetical protein AMS21_00100 [Gemmatimonas sp. SG8_38_2]|nr:MAG: hypothetical protein AMS21_00100 [Gemmatimonas sp. SG8_38_2]